MKIALIFLLGSVAAEIAYPAPYPLDASEEVRLSACPYIQCEAVLNTESEFNRQERQTLNAIPDGGRAKEELLEYGIISFGDATRPAWRQQFEMQTAQDSMHTYYSKLRKEVTHRSK